MKGRTSYTPWLLAGGVQPDLGDGAVAGWYDGADIGIDVTLGATTKLAGGPLEIGLPFMVDSINAPVVLTDVSENQTHDGWAVLRDDEPAGSVVLTREFPLPRAAPDDMLWSGGWPVELAEGDTLRIRGKMTASPSGCPDCHMPSGSPHTEGCEVAQCSICGYQATTCPHAGRPDRIATLWKGKAPAPPEDHLRWNRRRAQWEEHQPPPDDFEVADFGITVAAVTRPEWDPAEPPRYVVKLPPQPTEPYGDGWTIVWSTDKGQAIADLQRFIAQAQAALARMQDLP